MAQKISPKLPKTKEKDPLKVSFALLKDLGLKPKQVAFIVYYCNNGFKSREAYIKAGYIAANENSMDSSISILLRNLKVVEGLARYLDMVLGPDIAELKKRLFDVLFKRAFYTPEMFQQMYSDDGSTIDWEKLPPGWGVCIDGVETKCYGKNADIQKVVLKLANRDVAIDKLDKFIGMTKETTALEIGEISEEDKRKLADLFPGGKKK